MIKREILLFDDQITLLKDLQNGDSHYKLDVFNNDVMDLLDMLYRILDDEYYENYKKFNDSIDVEE